MTASGPGGKEESRPAAADATSPTDPPDRKRRRWLRRVVIVPLVLLGVGAVGVGSAEYYTARPNFCGSCHIMDPYYESWSQDKHGKNLDVRCVDCHYAPGERFTFKAKFKGLSQAASYFSGRAGGSRPRAHVSDASCLTSGCHGDEAYLTKQLPIGTARMEERVVQGQVYEVERKPTVHFTHNIHLNVDARLAEAVGTLEETRARIASTAPPAVYEAVLAEAVSVGPAAAREARIRDLLAEAGLAALEQDAMTLARTEHLHTRLVQLRDLTCAACHGYNPTGETHLAVDRQACYTCHFTNQAFNQDTGACLRCHEAPDRKIAVHEQATADAGTAAVMDHRDIVERGIDCASCHFDVIQGETAVSARDCTHCHDQERFLVDFAARTTETVEEYHRVHVAGQRARCADCHRAITHALVEPTLVATSAEFLQPVLSDCQHCHPNHHQEQVELLMGVGGSGTERPMPNAMFGSRVNCRACHTQPGSDFKGAALVRATQGTCVACHGDDYRRLYEQWEAELSADLQESQSLLKRVEGQVASAAEAGRPAPDRAQALLTAARHNIHLVTSANGIHNKNYALQLLDLSRRDLGEALEMLATP